MVNEIGYGGFYEYGIGQYTRADTVTTPSGNEISENSVQARALKRSGAIECETCKNRTYKDGSNESDVSFKVPGHISPESSASVVRAHEQQHVSNAYQKEASGSKVISASVSVRTAICPECGRSYTAGGETRTVIKYNEDNPYGRNAKERDAASWAIGGNIDIAV